MTRVRSPNYPAISLTEAVRRAEMVFKKEHRHWVAKDVALKHMGYTGNSGTALSVISAVQKYGLLDRKDGNYKVSDRTMTILHPQNDAEKQQAILDAAYAPALFSELLKEFKLPLPSDENLTSYLVRRGFSGVAISGVIRCFRDTISILSPQAVAESSAQPFEETGASTHVNTSQATRVQTNPVVTGVTRSVNAGVLTPMIVSFNGHLVEVSAKLDSAAAIDQLIRALEANKPLLPERRVQTDAENANECS